MIFLFDLDETLCPKDIKLYKKKTHDLERLGLLLLRLFTWVLSNQSNQVFIVTNGVVGKIEEIFSTYFLKTWAHMNQHKSNLHFISARSQYLSRLKMDHSRSCSQSSLDFPGTKIKQMAFQDVFQSYHKLSNEPLICIGDSWCEGTAFFETQSKGHKTFIKLLSGLEFTSFLQQTQLVYQIIRNLTHTELEKVIILHSISNQNKFKVEERIFYPTANATAIATPKAIVGTTAKIKARQKNETITFSIFEYSSPLRELCWFWEPNSQFILCIILSYV